MNSHARRVLLVETACDGTVGGSHQCLYDLVVRLDRAAWEPVVLFYQHNRFADLLVKAGVATHCWDEELVEELSKPDPQHPLGKLPMVARTARAVWRRFVFLRRERIDLVHINNSPLGNFENWLPAARLARVPITSHQRGTFGMPHGAVSRWLSRRFDAVIAISRHVAESLTGGGIPPERIRTVYDGIDLGRWVPRPVEEGRRLRAEAGVPDDVMLIVLVGHLRSWKGQGVALEALAALEPAVRERLRLWIVGEAPSTETDYAEGLHRFVRENALGDVVSFLGFRADIPELMGAADVVLHASTLPEPFGLVVVEGLALGKVVVASRLGGPAEIVEPGDGLLFDPAHPRELAQLLADLLTDPERRNELAPRARSRARAFDVERTAVAVANVWSEVLSGPRG